MLIVGLDYSCDRVSWAGKNVLDTKYAVDMIVAWFARTERERCA